MTGIRRALSSAVSWPPAVMALVVAWLGLAAPAIPWQHAPLPGPSHRYASSEPVWSQIVFPHLGAPTITVASVSSLGARVAADGPARPRAARFAVACYLTTLLLFSWLLVALGLHPLSVTAAALAFACSPAIWPSAILWHPYVALPPLALGVTLLTVQGIKRGALRLWPIAVLLALAAAETVAALALAAAWPLVTRVAADRRGVRVSRTLWIAAAGAVAVGILAHVASAAIVWRALSGATDGHVPSWLTALRAVTGQWPAVLDSYRPRALLAESLALARDWLRGIGPVVIPLAVAGAAWSCQRWGRECWLLPALLAGGFACTVAVGSTVGEARPLVPLLVASSFVFAAAGLDWLRSRATGHTTLAAVVIALGLMSCVNSLVLVGRAQGATFDEALDQIIDTFEGPTAMVADSAEVDRRLAMAMARAGWRNRWVRIALDSGAIEQALAEGRQVLAFDESASELVALGWALTSPRDWTVGSPGRRVVRMWNVEPCGYRCR